MNDIQQKMSIFHGIIENPKYIPILKEALVVEEKGRKMYREKGYDYYMGWEWFDCHAPPQTLNKMVQDGILDVAFKSRSSCHYLISNPDLVRETLESLEGDTVEEEPETPEDLFQNIVGLGNIKTMIRFAIESEKPAHLLMTGPPASAKTQFLLELSRLPSSYYALAPTLTEAGLDDMLFNYQPKFLLIDELDRLKGQDLGVLNSLMATGIVTSTKVRKTRTVRLDTKVFAAGIKIQRLPSDLLSRFIILRFHPYTMQEFTNVVVSALEKESISKENAVYIADSVWSVSNIQSDVRKCVSLARLAGDNKSRIEEVVRTFKKYN